MKALEILKEINYLLESGKVSSDRKRLKKFSSNQYKAMFARMSDAKKDLEKKELEKLEKGQLSKKI